MTVATVTQAYKYELDPTPSQARMFASHAGGARFAYNWGIATIIAALDARQAEKDAGAEPTVPVPAHFELCKMWTVWKDTAEWTDRATGNVTDGVGWVGENFVGTYQAALRDAAGAWKAFFASRSGKRKGRRVGRPRFRSKGKARESFQVHGAVFRLAPGPSAKYPGTRRVRAHTPAPMASYIMLPKIGPVRSHESTRKLRRRIDNGTARIVRGTVAKNAAGRWHIAITAEVQRDVRLKPSARQLAGGIIGVDLGVRDTITLSTGESVKNPAHLERSLRRLAAAQQTVARRTRIGRPSSARRLKAVERVGRIHTRVSNLRQDYLHNLSTRLIHEHAGIGVEGFDLQQVAARGGRSVPRRVRQVRNRLLAGSALGMFRWQLQSKSAWYGCQVLVTGAQAPSGRTCSRCGTAKATPIPPHLELFRCPQCGHVQDRRLNTALVLAQFARETKTTSGTGSESLNARGEDVSPGPVRKGRTGRSSLKREARPRGQPSGKTGTPST